MKENNNKLLTNNKLSPMVEYCKNLNNNTIDSSPTFIYLSTPVDNSFIYNEENNKTIEKINSIFPIIRPTSTTIINNDNVKRFKYDGKGEFYDENGDIYPSKKYSNIFYSVNIYILMILLFERMFYYTLLQTLQEYFSNELLLTNYDSIALVNLLSGIVEMITLGGGFVADSKFGKFKTMQIGAIMYSIGIILTCVATYRNVKNGILLFVAVFIFISLGSCGVRSSLQALGADQYDATIEKEEKEKKLFFSSYYIFSNLGALIGILLFTQMVNGMGSITKSSGNSFFIVYCICGGCLMLAFSMIFTKFISKRFIKKSAKKSSIDTMFKELVSEMMISKIGKIIILSFVFLIVCIFLMIFVPIMSVFHNEISSQPTNNPSYLFYINIFTTTIYIISIFNIIIFNVDPTFIFNKNSEITLINTDHNTDNNNFINNEDNTNDIATKNKFQNEKYLLLRVIPVISLASMYMIVCMVSTTNLYSVTCQMDLRVYGEYQLNGTYVTLGNIIIAVFMVPVMNNYIYPLIEKLFKMSLLPVRKILIGCIVLIIAMGSCIVLELVRKQQPLLVNENDSICAPPGIKMSDISFWWVLIPNAFIGLAEILILIPLFQVAYEEVSDNVKTISVSLCNFNYGLGSLFSSLMTGLFSSYIPNNLNNGHMEYLFYSITIFTIIITVLIYYINNNFIYKNKIIN